MIYCATGQRFINYREIYETVNRNYKNICSTVHISRDTHGGRKNRPHY